MVKKKYKQVFIVLVICISVVFCIIFSLKALYDIWWKQERYSPLNEIMSETEDIPVYAIWGKVFAEDSITNVRILCHEEGYILREILCVKDKTIYFLYEDWENNKGYWSIGTVEIGDTDIQTHYTMTVSVDKTYRRAVTSDYKDRNGYYYNGEIVLNDQQTVVTYNIESGETQKHNYHDYQFPKLLMYGECIDDYTVVLNIKDNVYEYSLQEMAAQSVGIAKLYELKERKIWNGESYIEELFTSYNSIQCVAGKVYAIGRCMNYGGSSGAAILEYDIEKDKWIYVVGKHVPMADNIHFDCYVVPQF